MKIGYKIILVILTVCIPFVTLITAFNVVLRMPDLYVYEFNNTEITSEIDLEMTGDELGHFFSDFMFGKQDEFKLYAEYRGREQAVFGTGEKISMENARRLLNLSLIFLAGFILLTALGYAILLSRKRKKELRMAFKGSVIAFIVICFFIMIAFHTASLRELIGQHIFICPFGVDDAIPLMLTRKFAAEGIAVGVIGAGILTGVLASATWKVTKPRRMFWQ